MRKFLNTLYVTNPDSYLTKDGENIVISVDNNELFRIPFLNIEGVIYSGYRGASHSLISACAERGICFTFLNEYGKFMARVEGAQRGNVLLRKIQYERAANFNEAVKISKLFVVSKIANSRTIINRSLRDFGERIDVSSIKSAVNSLTALICKVQRSQTLDEIRGYEGLSANVYFSVFDSMIVSQKDAFFMKKRSRRPPLDNLNALLSFVYTLLVHDYRSALESVGLDPAMGFLHALRPGRPSLALDLMEELRSYLADRLVLSLINRQQVKGEDFFRNEIGGISMKLDAIKVVLKAWQKRKTELITHPFILEEIEVGLIAYSQALLMARYLRGDLETYPPFFCK